MPSPFPGMDPYIEIIYLPTGDVVTTIEDAVLDLPAVFAHTYDVSGYEDFIDYREPPPPPELSEEDMAWLDGLLKAGGFRETAET